MSEAEIHHLAAAYALDALDAGERIAFEAHYGSCAICRAEVADFRHTASVLGTLTETSPPADLRRSVMAEIAATRQLSPLPAGVISLAERGRSRTVRSVLSLAAAAVMFIAGALLFGGRQGDDFDQEVAAIISDPQGRVTQLAGEAGSLTVAWSGDRAAVIGRALDRPGAGLVYELWLIDADGAHAMGLLDDASDGRIERIIEIDGSPAAWGVTIEPAAGSATPTEPILFVAQV